MENAVQALLIAAGVLIGLMILSLGISLYSSLSEYVEQTQQELIIQEIQQFNEQFTKYINCKSLSSSEVDFVLTIQDIVTAANTAYENNLEYGLTEQTGNNYYVTVKIDGEALENSKTTEILEKGYVSDNGGKRRMIEYKCSSQDVKINSITGRVNEVNFHKITE